MREENYLKRQVKEDVEIDKLDNTLNPDDELKLSGTWKPITIKIKRLHEPTFTYLSIFILGVTALIRNMSKT